MYNDYTPEPTKQSIEVLEQRYNDESLLMEYVAHGDFESIDKLAHLNSSGEIHHYSVVLEPQWIDLSVRGYNHCTCIQKHFY
jgi:hypothetical protein